MEAVTKSVRLYRHKMIESVYFLPEGVFLPHAALPAIFGIEVFGIGHPECRCKRDRVFRKNTAVKVRGHFCIGQDFSFRGKSPQRHQVHEHTVILFVTEKDLIVRGEADMEGLFHGHQDRTAAGKFL